MSHFDSYLAEVSALEEAAQEALQLETAQLDPAGIYDQSAALGQEMAYLEGVISRAVAAYDIVVATHARGKLNELQIKNVELSIQLVTVSLKRAEIQAAIAYRYRIEKIALLDRFKAAREEMLFEFEQVHGALWKSIERSRLQGAEADKQAQEQREGAPHLQRQLEEAKNIKANYLSEAVTASR